MDYVATERRACPRGDPRLKALGYEPASLLGLNAKAKALAYLEATT